MTTLTQPSLFDAPVMPYGDLPGHHASETSANGARAIKPKVGGLQDRVIRALHDTPGLTSRGLDRVLGTTPTRSCWPRCSELKALGYVEEIARCQEETGVWVTCWGLTETGEALARQLLT